MTLQLESVSPIDGFTYRWPDGDEKFSRGWEALAEFNGRRYTVRHGVGLRQAYGQLRVHTVTWVDGIPSVEGIAADDYAESEALLSLMRHADKKHIRSMSDVPPEYTEFKIVRHSDEIQAPYSKRSVAAKIRYDDLTLWALHALLRIEAYGRFPKSRSIREEPQSEILTEPVAESADVDRGAIVSALLSFGRSQTSITVAVDPSFTPHVEANRLVVNDPFAFLLAVIFDQGIPAERAWEAPYFLKERLGHLSPQLLAEDPTSVARAINTPPKLHRFIRKMPVWIVSAARKVVTEYDGSAERLWADQPTARKLQERLNAFVGIGQKKAAMAVEILARDLKMPIEEMDGSDIAFDVHVRRVFLRTWLAQRDDQAHMLEVARKLHPARPGELDFPAWLIGRQWCLAGKPNCPECPLVEACPRQVARAALVTGS